jgi:carbamate kinase
LNKANIKLAFAEMTGKCAAIGALGDLHSIVRGAAGTTITMAASGIEWAP